jgi:hypothetical protein
MSFYRTFTRSPCRPCRETKSPVSNLQALTLLRDMYGSGAQAALQRLMENDKGSITIREGILSFSKD